MTTLEPLELVVKEGGTVINTLMDVSRALDELVSNHGYFTFEWDCEDQRNSYPCCQSCGIYLAHEEGHGDNYLFFNVQAFDRSFFQGLLIDKLYLSWGEQVDPELVKQVFAARGMTVTGGGDPNKALCIEVEKV